MTIASLVSVTFAREESPVTCCVRCIVTQIYDFCIDQSRVTSWLERLVSAYNTYDRGEAWLSLLLEHPRSWSILPAHGQCLGSQPPQRR